MDDLHDFVQQTMEEGFQFLHRRQKEAQDALQAHHDEDLKAIEELHYELQKAKEEGYQQKLKCQKAVQDACEAEHRARMAEVLLTEEQKQRKEAETSLAKERLEMNQLRAELQEALNKKCSLEIEVDNLNGILDEMLKNQPEAYDSHTCLGTPLGLQGEPENFTVLTHSQLVEATSNFSRGLRIGNGGLGTVYKGWIHSKMVAIKVLTPGLLHGSKFQCELINLLKVQHPHLATPIGLCIRPTSLVYEYLLNGSLEDRLLSKDGIRPLTWESRVRIATEICSALVFLHSNGIIHGNLKPTNVLLDGNLNAKIINFGISHLFRDRYLIYVNTDPCGMQFYMDQEFFGDGQLTKQVDVYSLGIIILRLLTGKPALQLVEKIQKAVSSERLDGIIDRMAGDWPHAHVVQLANLGLECCREKRDSRPDLESHVLKVLQSMGASSTTMPTMERQEPSYFICPISQEIMRDPQVAADGFSYEAEALREWFNGGHDTSPLTNLRLTNLNLIPNLALRDAIRDWLDGSSNL